LLSAIFSYSEYAEYVKQIEQGQMAVRGGRGAAAHARGVPPVASRLYGYLLLCPRPVSLDQITEDLGISKSSASVAARLLESYTLARRHSQPRTKRALYAVADDYEAMIRQQNRLLDALAGQLNAGTEIAASEAVSARLEEMADFYRVMRGAMEDAMSRWKLGRQLR
jgi:DNA-binding transcriptional regulator GbsR (MarR family)